MRNASTQCCITGGGPAGMMAALLLARAGIDVVVLEKHGDFFRDFRGDTIHPSTLQLLAELGLLETFLQRPHDELEQISGRVGNDVLTIADFSALQTACKFIAFMPQWDFLDFLREQASKYPGFHLMMKTECRDLLVENERVVGVKAIGPEGEIEIRSDLVLGTDGRNSIVRERAALAVRKFGAPMDVLWMHIPKESRDVVQTLGVVGAGHVLVLIDRKAYWQAGFVIAKGTYESLRALPIEHLRDSIAQLAPFLAGRLQAIGSWDDVSLLEVRVDRLERWYRPGLLCIGDAAHAMSPMGGVGINLAIQDAVAAANLLWKPLRSGAPDKADLRAVQRRRMFPTQATQGVQVLLQNLVVRAVLKSLTISRPPLAVRVLASLRPWRRLIGRLMGLGFRPERIQSPLRAPGLQ